jgi:hypothetical protein
MINYKPLGGNSLEGDQMQLFCTLRHFPELKTSLAGARRLDARKAVAQVDTAVTKHHMTAHDKEIEESRRRKAKMQALCSTVLVEVDNQYADLKHHMREHRERYREERRIHLKLLDSSQTFNGKNGRTTSDMSAGSQGEPDPVITPLQTACHKLSTAGIFIDVDSTLYCGKCNTRMLAKEVRSSGLREVLSLPPYIALPDAQPTEFSSASFKIKGPSWRAPSREEQFRQLMRERIEVVLCVRLDEEELQALFHAYYGDPAR